MKWFVLIQKGGLLGINHIELTEGSTGLENWMLCFLWLQGLKGRKLSLDGTFRERFWKTILRIWYYFPGKVLMTFLLEMHSVMVESAMDNHFD